MKGRALLSHKDRQFSCGSQPWGRFSVGLCLLEQRRQQCLAMPISLQALALNIAVEIRTGWVCFALWTMASVEANAIDHFLHNHFCPDFSTSLGFGLVVEDWGESMVAANWLNSFWWTMLSHFAECSAQRRERSDLFIMMTAWVEVSEFCVYCSVHRLAPVCLYAFTCLRRVCLTPAFR